MLEAVTQAATWLLHHRQNFQHSITVLKEARNVKYGRFVAPGNFLRVEIVWTKDTDSGAIFKASGTVNNAQAVQARIELASFNLASKQPELSATDDKLRRHNHNRWALIAPSTPPSAAG